MSSLVAQNQLIKVEWEKICDTKDHEQITAFFEQHKDGMLELGRWKFVVFIQVNSGSRH